MKITCPNCKKENKNTNIKCEFCKTQLIDINEFDKQGFVGTKGMVATPKELKDLKKRTGCLKNIIFLIFLGPWLLTGLVLLGVGLFNDISEHNQAKGYETTTGFLKQHTNCRYEDNDEICEAIYEYEVNEITYSVSPSSLKKTNEFKEKEIVYYNPSNPSKSLICGNWESFTITGIITIIIVVIITIVLTLTFNKHLKANEKN